MKTRTPIVAIASAALASLATHLVERETRAGAEERYYGVPGDVNGDGGLNIADPVYLLDYIFALGPPPAACEPCPEPISRYVDNGDGTVADVLAGLMWEKTMTGPLTYAQAEARCAQLELAAFADWRVPSCAEVESLHGGPADEWPGAGRFWADCRTSTNIAETVLLPEGTRLTFDVDVPQMVRAVRSVTGDDPPSPCPSWYCTIYGRYVDNCDGTIADTENGLVWTKSRTVLPTEAAADGFVTFEEARAACDVLVVADRDDWRLPTLEELRTILLDPPLPPTEPSIVEPFDCANTTYWSSTPKPSDGHWGIDFAGGNDRGVPAWATGVRAVRGPDGR